ncbi:MAG: TonB-dependent receptor [Pseudomonadota bacterium]
MQKTISFKKKIIVSAIASALAGASVSALAQDDAVEEIVVSGIRASLTRAVDIKRDAAGVVDAISSEDIGKMPDANLAESLQRVTGISIDRSNGEGARLTARGFGPDYNLVTLNGRQLSSASIAEDGAITSGRSFDMSNVASESVSGVDVYKTGKASIPTGGIGATVNIKTAKPFDYEGFKASIGGKALYDTSADMHDELTPELSGYVSWSNETFGASLSLTHQERNSGRSGYNNLGFGAHQRRYTGGSIFDGGYTPGAVVINEPTLANPLVPGTGDLASRTRESNFWHTDTERERDNALLTLQFKPTDKITLTLDALAVETKASTQMAIYSLWFSDSAFPTNAVQWDDNSISSAPVYMWQEHANGNPRDIALKNFLRSNKTKTDDVGFNVGFEATDELSFEFDVHQSKSKATPWNAPGSNIALGIGVNTVVGQGLDMSGDLPLIASVVNNGSIKKSDVGSTISQLVNARTSQDITEARASGTYKFSDSASINFGLSSQESESIQKQSDIGNATMRGGWSVAAPGDISSANFELINFNDYFDGYKSNLSAESKAFFAGAGQFGDQATSDITGVRVTDFHAVARAMFADSPDATPYAANPIDSTDRKIVEEIQAAYVETSLDGSLGDMKVNLSAGLRYERTDIESYSRVAPRMITWTADRDFNNTAVGVAGALPYAVSEFSYDNVLPNVDLTFNVTDELIVRASSSKTIARANYDRLQEGGAGNTPLNGSTLALGSPGNNNTGNVKLKPIESNNIDLSVEYYFNETDYVSVGFFDKRVPNFIGLETREVTYPDTLDPTRGPRARAALAALQAGGYAVNERSIFQMVGMMNSTANGCINTSAANLCGTNPAYNPADYGTWANGVDIVAVAGDPGIVNRTTVPVNSQDAVLNGWEFAGQYFFGDSGFGMQANYTVVNGSIGYDLNKLSTEPGATQFALLGLSDTANVVGIYEKDQWQARIAYNWRDKFLNNANDDGEPQFTEDYGQVDINVGFKVTEDLTLALEASNVLGDDQKTHGRTSNQVRSLNVLEPRYALSARYNF